MSEGGGWERPEVGGRLEVRGFEAWGGVAGEVSEVGGKYLKGFFMGVGGSCPCHGVLGGKPASSPCPSLPSPPPCQVKSTCVLTQKKAELRHKLSDASLTQVGGVGGALAQVGGLGNVAPPPTLQAPLTLHPLTLHPLTLHPLTRHPLTLHPPDPSPPDPSPP